MFLLAYIQVNTVHLLNECCEDCEFFVKNNSDCKLKFLNTSASLYSLRHALRICETMDCSDCVFSTVKSLKDYPLGCGYVKFIKWIMKEVNDESDT